jgi:hypothetical protein
VWSRCTAAAHAFFGVFDDMTASVGLPAPCDNLVATSVGGEETNEFVGFRLYCIAFLGSPQLGVGWI